MATRKKRVPVTPVVRHERITLVGGPYDGQTLSYSGAQQLSLPLSFGPWKGRYVKGVWEDAKCT